MNWRNTANRYGSLSIGLHWLTLLLIAGAYACIELRENFPKGSDIREGLKTWHFALGLCVLMLVAVRVLVHLTENTPRIDPAPPRWQHRLAMAMHVALYVFMIGMPILGWLTLSAEGEPIPFFGIVLPPLIAQSKSVAQWTADIHEAAGTVGYFLVGLHALAALYHHYFVRDNTLVRMIPNRH